jgi:hypothetical protein
MKDNGNFPFLANQTGKFSSLRHHGKHSYSDHDGPHIYKRARILCWNTAGGEEQLLNDVLYIKVNTKYGSEWQHNFYAFFYSKNIKKFTPKIWYSMRMMTPKIWYPMKLMTHKFDIPWSWWKQVKSAPNQICPKSNRPQVKSALVKSAPNQIGPKSNRPHFCYLLLSTCKVK